MFRRSEDERHDGRQDGHGRAHGPIEAREVGMNERGGGGGGSEATVVGQGARLEGTVVSAGSLRIDGQVTGKITAEGDVMLSPQSRVEADIEATNVTVAGSFKGNIVAKSRAELAKGGRVDGNVTSKTLVVAEGAVFSGQSIMGGGSSELAPKASPDGSTSARTETEAAATR